MTVPILEASLTFSNAVLAPALLLAGGCTLIAFAFAPTANNAAFARRVELLRPGTRPVHATARGIEEDYIDVSTLPRYGLGPTEQRMVISGLAPFSQTPEKALRYFALLRGLCAVMAGIVAAFALHSSGLILTMAAAFAAALAGWLLPQKILQRKLKARRRSVETGLPDALELLAVCVDSGLALEGGLKRVAAELKSSHRALASELQMTWAELNILPDREQALQNFAARVDLVSVNAVVATLVQTLKFGTPLAKSLRLIASEARNEQLATLEERASRLPAMLTLPVMLLIMPTVFLVVGGPAVIRVMDMLNGPTP